MEYHILSLEHKAWWGSDKCGYTRKIENAGTYSIEEAVEICNSANRGALDELPVEVEVAELLELDSFLGKA